MFLFTGVDDCRRWLFIETKDAAVMTLVLIIKYISKKKLSREKSIKISFSITYIMFFSL